MLQDANCVDAPDRSVELMKMLLGVPGVDVNLACHSGRVKDITPLHIAVNHKHVKTVRPTLTVS
jgi:hypothetical protein